MDRTDHRERCYVPVIPACNILVGRGLALAGTVSSDRKERS